jgi:hypothetical protein
MTLTYTTDIELRLYGSLPVKFENSDGVTMVSLDNDGAVTVFTFSELAELFEIADRFNSTAETMR